MSCLHFLTQGPVKRKLLHKLGSGRRKKSSFDVEIAGDGEEPALLGNGSGVGGRVQDLAFSPADFATVETDLGGGGGGKRRMNLYQKHRSKARYESTEDVVNRILFSVLTFDHAPKNQNYLIHTGQYCRSHGNIYDLTSSGATKTPANTPVDEEFRFFGVGRAGEDEEDVGKSQYFDALETVEEVEEAIAQAAVVHAEDGLATLPSVRLR